MKKILAATFAAVIAFACLPVLSGCSASVSYQLNEDEEGNKYYTVYCTGYTSSLKGELVIPSYYGEEGTDAYAPVTEIASQAFANTYYSKVTIPSTITTIGSAAFAYCYSLGEVVFEEGIKLSAIPRGMFGYCSDLTQITVPDGVTGIAPMAFLGCSSLSSVTLPEGITIIGAQAFESCTELASITLPQSLKTIGDLAFYSSGLKQIIIPENVCDVTTVKTDENGEEVTTTTYGVGMGAFHSCLSLERAVVLGKIGTIRSGSFGYCTALAEIYLPETVEKIEGVFYASDGSIYCGHAFHNDAELKDVYFAGASSQWDAIEIDNESITNNGATYNNSAITDAQKHYQSVYNG